MTLRRALHVLAFALPLTVAVSLSLAATRHSSILPGPQWLKPVSVTDVSELEQLFDDLHYDWPLSSDNRVPRLLLSSIPGDLSEDVSVAERKANFLRILLPVILAENRQIRQQRAWLQGCLQKGVARLDDSTKKQLQQLAHSYRVKDDLNDPEVQRLLLQRVDEVPVALVLAQAANESGWGTSRFVRQANNLFGHWTYHRDKGLVPLDREQGKTHRVRVFPSLRSSVRAYLHNLNTSRAYKRLRKLRAILRENNQPLDGYHLAAGLLNYSERGQVYVNEIRALIRSNHLAHFETLRLREGTWRLPSFWNHQ
jgi:Bax protein